MAGSKRKAPTATNDRRDVQVSILDEEIANIERRIDYQSTYGAKDSAGLFIHDADADKWLVLMAVRRQLKDLCDRIAYGEALK